MSTPQDLPPQLPFVFDRSNGGIYGGTPTADGASTAENNEDSTQNTSTDPINIFDEMPDSPTIDLGEQATITHKFKIDPVQTQLAASIYTRGTVWTDSAGRQSKVLNFRVDSQEGDFAIVTVTSEGLNFYIPPADYSIEPVLINPAAQKHPRYAPLQQKFLSQSGSAPNFTYAPFFPLNVINQAVIYLSLTQGNTATTALQDPLNFYVDNGTGGVQSPSASPDLIAQAAALELLKKLRRGQETFYLAGYKVEYSVFSFDPQDLDPGGRIEDPTESGDIPPEYWTDYNADNIFTALTETMSPQFYANGITWFRNADTQIYQRTWYRNTMSWNMAPAGGPILLSWNGVSQTYNWYGQWDEQWYTPAAPGTLQYPPYDIELNIQ